MAIYMKVTNMAGDVTAQNYDGQIKLDSVDFGAQRGNNTRVGKVSDRGGETIDFTEVVLYKQCDKATPYLFQAFCKRSVMDKIEIDVCGSDTAQSPIAKYVLSKVLVSSYQHFLQTDNMPSEVVKLNFTKVSISYIGKDTAHNAGSPITAGYDLETSKPL